MIPIWVRSLAFALEKSGMVAYLRTHPAKLIVRYTTGIIERYWFVRTPPPSSHRTITHETGRLTTTIAINHFIEPDLLTGQSEFNYVAINKKHWANATLMDRAVAIHRLVTLTCNLGYQTRLPQAVIADDLAKLKNYQDTNHISAGRINLCPRHTRRPGIVLLAHFFSLELAKRPPSRKCLIEMATRPRIIYNIINRLVARKRPLSSHHVLRMLRKSCGPIVVFCRSYIDLFKSLRIKSVFDPHPETGTKALACALLGIPYYTEPNDLFDAALDRGFAGYVGLDHHYHTGVPEPHYTIVDFNLAEFDYAQALAQADKGQRLLVFVPAAQRDAALAECRPDAIIDVDVRWTPGHFFCW